MPPTPLPDRYREKKQEFSKKKPFLEDLLLLTEETVEEIKLNYRNMKRTVCRSVDSVKGFIEVKV